ncbi:MAG TPA: hypothetical protein ENN99_12680 [Chloroflexi bacterium]|nr:hypothetical protein [Chloroflexota bacterium]
MTNILLSPIGRSPGAVTGIYYALAEQEDAVQIDTVVLLSTAMPQVKKAAKMVGEALGPDKVVVLPLRAAENKPSHDFNDVATALNFIHLANAVLDHANRADGNQVYIGISGGRSSMGALATLSAYVYGAAGIYHLWVDEKIEEQGDITQLLNMRRSERIKILNPPADQRRLVSIPLAPFDTLWDRGRLGQVLAERPEAREALLRAVTDVEMRQLKTLQEQREASFEEVTKRLREIFQGTEIEDAVEVAIKVAGGDEKPLEWEVAFKPYIKPEFWTQVKRDLSDWENWKAGADRLLKFVEAVATPLAVAGFAAVLNIPKWS